MNRTPRFPLRIERKEDDNTSRKNPVLDPQKGS